MADPIDGPREKTGMPSATALTMVLLEWLTTAQAPGRASSKLTCGRSPSQRSGLSQTTISRLVKHRSVSTTFAVQTSRVMPMRSV